MTAQDGHHTHNEEPRDLRQSVPGAVSWPVRVLMFALIGVIAYFVITEHRAHLWAAWPLLFLLVCPLMHLFHGGHGGHGGDGRHGEKPRPSTAERHGSGSSR